MVGGEAGVCPADLVEELERSGLGGELAGVWGHSTRQRQILEQGDVEEGLNAAAAIGDDRMQEMSTGRVAPDSFTHGSSEQRVAWFRRGLSTGDPSACDTFSAGR